MDVVNENIMAVDNAQDDNVVDEYIQSFEALEESDNSDKIAEYTALLNNARDDDKAVKIKEQCIYRCPIFKDRKLTIL